LSCALLMRLRFLLCARSTEINNFTILDFPDTLLPRPEFFA
jgi:hypothetical protein